MLSTEDLIEAAKQGSVNAFTELVGRYERAAWIIAWRVLRDHHLASDATQNAFIEAYRSLSELRSASAFGVWLMRITHRQAIRISKQPFPTVPLSEHEIAVEGNPTNSDPKFDVLITAVGDLPDHERLVVVLRYFNGYSIDEVAKSTGRSVGTVTKQISRAIARLKKQLRTPFHEARIH